VCENTDASVATTTTTTITTTTTTTTTTNTNTTITTDCSNPGYVILDSSSKSCDIAGLELVQTESECEEAADFIGLADTSVGIMHKSNRVAGCVWNTNNNRLQFNKQLDSSANLNSWYSLICGACNISSDSSSTTTTITTTIPFITANATTDCSIAGYVLLHPSSKSCDIAGLEVVQTKSECEAAADFLGSSDTSAGLMDKSNRVAGCVWNRGKRRLQFNTQLDSSANVNSWYSLICGVCENVDASGLAMAYFDSRRSLRGR
jgi:hypothetical protein